MSAFDRMLAREGNRLPENTGSYYELEKGDLKYDGIKNVNDAIDAQIQDFNQRTEWAIQESQRYHKVKDAKLDSLTGLISIAGKFKKWEDARKEASAQFDRFYTDGFDDYTGKPEQREEVKKFDEQNNKKLKDQNIQDNNVVKTLTNPAIQSEISLIENNAGLKQSAAQRENISGVEAGNQYKEGWQPYFNRAIHEKKQLVNSRTGQKMPYAMSYMEVLESDNRELQQYLPWLYRDIFMDYHAAMNEQGLVDTMGDKYFRYKVAPAIIETGATLQNRLLSRQLEISIKNAKDNINQQVLSQFEAANTEEEQIEFIFGENGFLAQREITIDGKKDNKQAWEDLTDWMVWAVEEGYVTTEEALDIINSDKIPKRGTKDTTTIDGLKNRHASAFKKKVFQAIGSEQIKNSRAETAIENDAISGIADGVITELKETAGDELLTPNDILKGTQLAIQRAKEEGYDIDINHPSLAKLKNLWNTSDTQEFNARQTLNWQIENEKPLSDDLFKYIPRSGATDGRDRSYYEAQGKEFGIRGLTPQEENKARIAIVSEMTSPKTGILSTEKANSEEGQLMIDRAWNLYEKEYKNNVTTGFANAAPGSDLTSIKTNSQRLALDAVRDQLSKMRADPKYKGDINSDVVINRITTSEYKDAQQVIKFIKKEGQSALIYDKYWSPGEQKALEEYIEWKKNPKGIPPVNYYSAYSPHYNADSTEYTNPQAMAEARLEATAHLRDKNETNEKLDSKESNNIPEIKESTTTNGTDNSKVCQAAINPDKLDIMLNDLAVPDRNFDTVYSAGFADANAVGGYQEENFNNELPQGKPLSQTTVEEVAYAAGRNPKLRFGTYDIPADIVYNMYDKGIIDKDEIFDEDLQKEIVLRAIVNIANERGSNKTWSNTYRRNSWLTRQEKDQFKRIITSLNGEENIDPYNDIQLLAPECAKALIGSVMGQ